MRVGANDIDGGPAGTVAGSPMGSSASLTEESLRRRPSHSRKASVESLDLDELPQLMQGVHLAGGRPRRYNLPRRGSDEHLSASTVEASVASRAASGSSSAAPLAAGGVVADTDDEGEELTSTEKPLPPGRARRALPDPVSLAPAVASGPRHHRLRSRRARGPHPRRRRRRRVPRRSRGRRPGEKEYKGGDVSIVSIPADAPSATSPSSSTSSPKRTATTTKPPRPDPRARPERSARRPATPSLARRRGRFRSSTKARRTRPRASRQER